jgi:selenocysteine-specific elongation factor
MTRQHARALGVPVGDGLAPGVVSFGEWMVAEEALTRWTEALAAAVRHQAGAQPLDPSLSFEAGRRAAGIPDRSLVSPAAERAGLHVRDGRLWLPGVTATLGGAEPALRDIEAQLAEDPFAAPERGDLHTVGLGPRELAAAERTGRVLRLGDEVVVLPTAPALAMRRLAALPQPFTTSQAREALGTTRRVAIPLLEHLDSRGWTRRVDGTHREVVRARSGQHPRQDDPSVESRAGHSTGE